MARMPTFDEIREDFARGVRTAEQRIEHPFGHADAATQTPAPGPVTLASAPPKENDMSLSNDLHAIAARLESLGEDAVGALESVNANPETAKVFTALRELTGLNVPSGLVSLVTGGLDELVTRLKANAAQPQGEQASFTPAGPQVAGQA